MNLIYVHGGVSGREREEAPSLAGSRRAGLGAAGALDAVEASVRSLEDNPVLNAGLGSVLNRRGEIELDAGLADGTAGRFAGVAGVAVRHPISLARRVLEDTPHVLLVGEAAHEVGEGLERLEGSTQEQHERWARAEASGELALDRYGASEHVDTVGAVVLDDAGHIAAGSSTGGVFGQMQGRVGDSPIFGAGIYASAEVAVVGTGVGELFLETLACYRAGALVENGHDPQSACERIIGYLGEVKPLGAGLLAIDREGRAGAAFRGGSWAVEGPDGPLRPARLP
ncbi:MAG: isoaspartyl peptidase/L-asparaginase [Actinomycetota bacterium]|nr:isoaspartyl peptidase/L-asparaginase [Actinomycetota bacterium]